MRNEIEQDKTSEVFDRVQQLMSHMRRRRWDSAVNSKAFCEQRVEMSEMNGMSPELVTERFDSLEKMVARLIQEIRRADRRSKKALRYRVTILVLCLVLIGMTTFNIWLGFPRNRTKFSQVVWSHIDKNHTYFSLHE